MNLVAMSSDDQLSPYIYSPLSVEAAIRLLKVEPAHTSCQLRTSLYEARLETSPKYAALSYVWGDMMNTESLDCSGQTIDVTRSLASALRRLRRPQEAIILWVDAICINQKDIEERSSQVALMATIYRGAEEVLIWLGDDSTGHANLAFRSVERYLQKSQAQAAILSQDTGEFDYRELQPFLPDKATEADKMAADAVADIFRRPWFSRVWVLQEVGLATKATAFCGIAETAFENLIAFAAIIGYTSYDFATRIPAWEIREAYDCMWSTYHVASSWRDRMPLQYHKQGIDKAGFVDILHTSLRRGATDKRDHVYSLLGHPSARIARGATKAAETLVTPSYYISFQELSGQLTRSLLINNQDTTVLSLVQHKHSSEIELGDAPSWVPNLELTYQVIDHIVFGLGAGGGAMPSICFTPVADRIEISGLMIDVVDWTGDTLQQSDFGFDKSGDYSVSFTTAISHVRRHLLGGEFEDAKHSLLCPLEPLALVLCSRALRVPSNFSTHHARSEEIGRLVRGLEMYLGLSEHRIKSDDITEKSQEELSHFLYWAKRYCPRRVFGSKEGYLGLGPPCMAPNDRVCVLFGSRVPSIIRPSGSQGEYKFVGECYVYKLMEGEALDEWKDGAREEVRFVLH